MIDQHPTAGPPTTRTINGFEITLVPGRRYLASRPMMVRRVDCFDVTIHDITDGRLGLVTPVSHVVVDLNRDQANAFLEAFNNEESSWAGRMWI